MRDLDVSRYVLSAGAATAMLAGCGGPQPPIGASGAIPQSHAVTAQFDRGTSWMLPEAKGEDLLYVADAGTGSQAAVDVFSFPALKPVGKLTNQYRPSGECVDGGGNVYIVDAPQVVEYRHGFSAPLRTIDGPSESGRSFNLTCAIDSSTGNLAVVTDNYDYSGNAYVYQRASGTPTEYQFRDIGIPGSCTYDIRGDLIVAGRGISSYPSGVNELRPGKSVFETLYVNDIGTLDGGGGAFWYGGRLVFGEYGPYDARYEFSETRGNRAHRVGRTPLPGVGIYHTGFFIENDRLIQPSTDPDSVFVYTYPGGDKVGEIDGFSEPVSAVISRARRL